MDVCFELCLYFTENIKNDEEVREEEKRDLEKHEMNEKSFAF